VSLAAGAVAAILRARAQPEDEGRGQRAAQPGAIHLLLLACERDSSCNDVCLQVGGYARYTELMFGGVRSLSESINRCCFGCNELRSTACVLRVACSLQWVPSRTG
jgi:hypothetical protein